MVKTQPSNGEGVGSISDQGAKSQMPLNQRSRTENRHSSETNSMKTLKWSLQKTKILNFFNYIR